MLKNHNCKTYTTILLVTILLLPFKGIAQNKSSKGRSTKQNIISPVPIKEPTAKIIKSTKPATTNLTPKNNKINND